LAGPIKISILADGSAASKAMKDVAKQSDSMGKAVEGSGSKVSKGFSSVGSAAVGMNASVDAASSALSAIDSIQQSSYASASRLARAQADVEQAMNDREQAVNDLRQATEDFRQSEIDGKQATVDGKQAQIDAKQAALDATVAQKDYSTAVKTYGKNSVEARQAAIDLSQAKADLSQADVDATQAQADVRQAVLDGKQALTDQKQAVTDSKTAQLDLNDAQRAMDPTPVQQGLLAFQQYAPVLALAAIGVQSVGSFSAIAAAATKAYAGAQWLLNAAMTANPIGLVVVAVAALVAALVIAYKKSETFRRIVNGAFRAVKTAASAAFGWIKSNWPLLLAVVTGPIGLAVLAVVKNFGRIKSGARSVYNWISGNWRKIYGFLTNPISTAVSVAVRALGKITTKARGIPGQIKGFFKGAGSWLVSAGKNVIQGLWNGISSMGGWLSSQISGFISRNVTGKIKGVLGIASPSKVMRGLGKWLPRGLALGIDDEVYRIQRAAKRMSGASVPGLAAATRVSSTRSTASSGNSSGSLVLEVQPLGNSAMDQFFAEMLRKYVRVRGGNVQTVLGGR